MGHQVSGGDLPCELPPPRALDLYGRGDEPLATEDGRDDRPGLDAPAAQKLEKAARRLRAVARMRCGSMATGAA